ncbi:hypothetical protein [Archangium sp.]|uniref:hypothetical protein n=1 Tax=Archangium sp. TaxID=1872627 RepID=UPI002D3A79CC|nr:hypothetical protein [Archangium sp.]HYO57658.1 hypothetical protein [Archangium sp.]
MSGGPYLCEYCGYGSHNKERCTHCGKDISDLVDQPLRFRQPLSGKLTIRVYDRADAERTWKDLAKEWDRLEQETNLCLLPSQMEKFPPKGDVLELYGKDVDASSLQEALPGRLTIEFQELPYEQIPRRPRGKPLRPPTVPKNKR